jgi:hypothetical protein
MLRIVFVAVDRTHAECSHTPINTSCVFTGFGDRYDIIPSKSFTPGVSSCLKVTEIFLFQPNVLSNDYVRFITDFPSGFLVTFVPLEIFDNVISNPSTPISCKKSLNSADSTTDFSGLSLKRDDH